MQDYGLRLGDESATFIKAHGQEVVGKGLHPHRACSRILDRSAKYGRANATPAKAGQHSDHEELSTGLPIQCHR
ncbi:MAG TPA: hypothetical protein VKA04_07540, partial [Pseudodesulfovibrio sp.]|nr:hypothetical protein [Pseudodesulfovibrio sp.]